jgi:HTH-type transcriptional regulator / antitoxin HigA
MAGEIKPIRTKRDYEAALKQVERLWGAKTGTHARDRLDVLATLIVAYEAEHYPMDPPDPIEAIKFPWSSKGSPGGTWRRSLARALASPRF